MANREAQQIGKPLSRGYADARAGQPDASMRAPVDSSTPPMVDGYRMGPRRAWAHRVTQPAGDGGQRTSAFRRATMARTIGKPHGLQQDLGVCGGHRISVDSCQVVLTSLDTPVPNVMNSTSACRNLFQRQCAFHLP